jgi:hypothetical protein
MVPQYPLGVFKDKGSAKDPDMSEFSLIISGFGGQGVLSAGRMVALAAMYEGKEVSWLPSRMGRRCVAARRTAAS